MNAHQFVAYHQNKKRDMGSQQLVKLHGSVNWIKNRKGEIEEHPYNSTFDSESSISATGDVADETMTYPLSQKQLYFSPYIQLFTILDADLHSRDFWIVIGYSFRDVIIRNMFEKALGSQDARKILLIHPHPLNVKKLFTREVRNQIVPLKLYFGRKRDYDRVNENIARSLQQEFINNQ